MSDRIAKQSRCSMAKSIREDTPASNLDARGKIGNMGMMFNEFSPTSRPRSVICDECNLGDLLVDEARATCEEVEAFIAGEFDCGEREPSPPVPPHSRPRDER